MSEAVAFTLIIPAHNEEAVIARCLAAILDPAPAQPACQIIVAANGCTDRTVEIARSIAPQALVLDLPVGSKTAAINAASTFAAHYPRIVLDADVVCGYHSLAALAEALGTPGIMTAAPAIRIETEASSGLIRAYYRAWLRQPYATAGKGGAGCYALSRAAIERVGDFPPIVGDDVWIHTRFPDEQKRYVTADSAGRAVFSVVRPPRTAREQIRVEARRRNGNAEVARAYPSPYFAHSNQGGGVLATLRSGTSPFDVAVFAGIKLAARALALWERWNGRGSHWTRDQSTRAAVQDRLQ